MSTVSAPAPTSVVARDFYAGFEAGVQAGLTVGYQEGWDAHVELTQLRFGLAILDEPTHEELTKARAFTNEPCALRCRNCSRCTRYAAAWSNQRLYGSPDYPGGSAEPW